MHGSSPAAPSDPLCYSCAAALLLAPAVAGSARGQHLMLLHLAPCGAGLPHFVLPGAAAAAVHPVLHSVLPVAAVLPAVQLVAVILLNLCCR